jgi:hypothetical protein
MSDKLKPIHTKGCQRGLTPVALILPSPKGTGSINFVSTCLQRLQALSTTRLHLESFHINTCLRWLRCLRAFLTPPLRQNVYGAIILLWLFIHWLNPFFLDSLR